MHTSILRKVGGSVMLAIPPVLLELLQLRPGAEVGLEIEQGRLVMATAPRHRYRLEELLAQCEPTAERSAEERAWLGDRPRGRELI